MLAVQTEIGMALKSNGGVESIEDALVIDEPWITKILRGEKTWELRSRHTYKRGWMGLIRKGSGLVVGVANLVESLGPMSVAEIRAAASLHLSGSTSDTTSYRYVNRPGFPGDPIT